MIYSKKNQIPQKNQIPIHLTISNHFFKIGTIQTENGRRSRRLCARFGKLKK